MSRYAEIRNPDSSLLSHLEEKVKDSGQRRIYPGQRAQLTGTIYAVGGEYGDESPAEVRRIAEFA